MTLETQLSAGVQARLTGAVDLGDTAAKLARRFNATLTHGTGAGQADRVWMDSLTVAASGSADIDLAGALVDALGASVVFARVKAILVAAAAENTNNVVIGNAASNAWAALLGATHTVTLRPGGLFAVFAGAADPNGYAVTAGTGDILRVSNSAGGSSVSLDVAIIGASA